MINKISVNAFAINFSCKQKELVSFESQTKPAIWKLFCVEVVSVKVVEIVHKEMRPRCGVPFSWKVVTWEVENRGECRVDARAVETQGNFTIVLRVKIKIH